jgi:putative heme-binding domain-containing protein
MRRFAAALFLPLALAGTGRAEDSYAGHVAATPPRSPAEEARLFHLPPGFEAQLVAAEPDIQKPLNLAFDDHGRLWVSDTVEYPFPNLTGTPRDTIKVLEDFGPDGRARKVTTFADGLNIPIGVLPLPAARPQQALVYSIPRIWRMRDDRGAGRADSREPLYGTYGFKDTHGMTSAFTLGFDGWVYACHGFANTSTITARDGSSVTMTSGNTYRMRPDGSRVEWFTHGQVNPFGLCLDPLGNVYSADCHSRPLYLLLRGAYYPSFGKPHDGLGFGPEMVQHDHGSTAIAGIVCYDADNFPAAYRGTMFVGNVVTNRINHDRVEWHGSSPKGIETPDFLISDDPWFRPVAIQLGPDGALYVADFYNRIIGHYEVPLTHPGRDRERGRIWRIVYRGAAPKAPPPRWPDWTRAAPAALVRDLGSPNLLVRLKATNQLIECGASGVDAVRQALASPQASPTQWAHGLWVLERSLALDGETLSRAAKHADRLVRVHAQRILSERPVLVGVDRELVLAGLRDDDAHVRRAAADALGRHPDAANVRPLLRLRHAVPEDDTHLLHVVRMALRDQLVPAGAYAALSVDGLDERDERAIADVSLGVPTAEAAEYLLRHLGRHAEGRERTAEIVHHVARYGAPAAAGALLDFLRSRPADDLRLQAALCRTVIQGTQERGGWLAEALQSWAEGVTRRLMAATAPEDVQAGVELVGILKVSGYTARLSELAASASTPEALRQAALDALIALDNRHNAAAVGGVLADPGAPMPLREHAAELLAQANQPPTRQQLLAALPVSPAPLQNTIAECLAGSRAGAEELLRAVAAGKASARLLQERGVAVRLEQTRVPDLKARLEKLTIGLPRPDERVEKLLRARHDGFAGAKTDAERGKQVFARTCANCHQLGGEGAKIGPQLDGIGLRGLDRLLEDVLDPNRNVDQAFRLTTLEMKSGRVVSGLLLREEGAVLVLADAQGKEVRVPREAVAERTTSQVSPMPSDFADKITEPEFYDLLAYLLRQRPKPGR